MNHTHPSFRRFGIGTAILAALVLLLSGASHAEAQQDAAVAAATAAIQHLRATEAIPADFALGVISVGQLSTTPEEVGALAHWNSAVARSAETKLDLGAEFAKPRCEEVEHLEDSRFLCEWRGAGTPVEVGLPIPIADGSGYRLEVRVRTLPQEPTSKAEMYGKTIEIEVRRNAEGAFETVVGETFLLLFSIAKADPR